MELKVGQCFEHYFLVSGEVYEGFKTIFGDHNPLHTDENFAVKHGFGQKVMHGNILNGFLSYFIGELLPYKEVMILSQTINFKKPVFLNDRLRFSATVTDQSEAVGVNVFSFKFQNEELVTVASGKIQIKDLV